MDVVIKYLYFLGSLVGLLLFSLVYVRRRDLRNRMVRVGISVGLVGVISEAIFFQDYWKPPLLFRIGDFGGIEDLFFGFAAGGLGAVIYSVAFHKRFRKKNYPHYWIISLVVISEIISIYTLFHVLKINSIFASAIGFTIPALIIMLIRRDLVVETIVSALLAASLLVLVEMALLIIAPTYLQNYYLLYGKAPLLLGLVPITEFVWGMAFGSIVGPLYDAELGKGLINFRRNT